MSHFPADKMGYFDAIQLFFMELTGRALMFSGRDLELLSRWRSEGATVSVVCKGVEAAFRAMDSNDPPRSVYACRHHIEPLVDQARKMAAGRHDGLATVASSEAVEEPLVTEALVTVERAGRAASTEILKDVYRRAWKELRDLDASQDDGIYEHLAQIEESLAQGYFDALDDHTREAIDSRIAQETAGLERMDEEVEREHILARRRLFLVRDYGMPSLWR